MTKTLSFTPSVIDADHAVGWVIWPVKLSSLKCRDFVIMCQEGPYSTQLNSMPMPWMVIRSGTFTLLHSHTSTNIMKQGDRVSQLSQANGKQQADKPHREPIYLTNSCDIIQITATTNNNGYSLIVNHLKFRCCGRGHQYFSSIRYYRRWRSAWANPAVPSPIG